MKNRIGFVSNSSTTSFCIWGAYFSEISDEKAEAAENEGFRVIWGDWDGVWVGKELSEAPDDMTMGEFKKEVEDRMKEIFGDDIECGLHEEAWRDG